jgi:hypothetical protein
MTREAAKNNPVTGSVMRLIGTVLALDRVHAPILRRFEQTHESLH